MKKMLFIYLSLVSLNSIAQETTINDKNAELRNVSAFNAIKVSGSIEVLLSQSTAEAVAVSASEEKYRDRIKTEVVGSTLKIYFDADKFNWNIGNKKLRAYVSFKDINSLEITGASSVKINGTVSEDRLDVKLTGASDLSGDVKLSKLNVDLSGASDLKITGDAGDIDIDATGASDVKSYDLKTDNCTVKATGACDIRITVNKEISVHATGASSIFYKGEAIIKDVHTSGASSIAKKG